MAEKDNAWHKRRGLAPSAAYEATEILEGEQSVSPIEDDPVRWIAVGALLLESTLGTQETRK